MPPGNIVDGPPDGATAGTPAGATLSGGGGGGFRIPKIASSFQPPGPPPPGGVSGAVPPSGGAPSPPQPPSHQIRPPVPPPGAPRDDRYARGSKEAKDSSAAADSSMTEDERKLRKHKGTRKHKHMLVLDLNGLLVDRRMSPFEHPADGTKVAPYAKFGKFYIYNRPHMHSFVEWTMEHFTVGVWSSAQHHNARTLVNHIWGKTRDKLAFVWGQDRCTHVGAMDPHAGHRSKPILLKDLKSLWATASYARFGPNNTLLLDDSPYKAVMNPPDTAIHPAEDKLTHGGGEDADAARDEERLVAENLLGPGGALREYLAAISASDSVTDYVRANPWHTRGPSAPASDEDVMTKARKGGEAVAAAAAAAAGFDANEIDLGGLFRRRRGRWFESCAGRYYRGRSGRMGRVRGRG